MFALCLSVFPPNTHPTVQRHAGDSKLTGSENRHKACCITVLISYSYLISMLAYHYKNKGKQMVRL